MQEGMILIDGNTWAAAEDGPSKSKMLSRSGLLQGD